MAAKDGQANGGPVNGDRVRDSNGRFLKGHPPLPGCGGNRGGKKSPDGIVNMRQQLGDIADMVTESELFVTQASRVLLGAKTPKEKAAAMGYFLGLFHPYMLKLPSPDPKAARGELAQGTDSTPDEIVGAMDATIPDMPTPTSEDSES